MSFMLAMGTMAPTSLPALRLCSRTRGTVTEVPLASGFEPSGLEAITYGQTALRCHTSRLV